MFRGKKIGADTRNILLRSSAAAPAIGGLLLKAGRAFQPDHTDSRKGWCRRSYELIDAGNGTMAWQTQVRFGHHREYVQAGSTDCKRAMGRLHRRPTLQRIARSGILSIRTGDG